MANGAVYDDQGGVYRLHDRKLDALEDIVEASQGQPILVYYSYKHDAQRIRERFPEAKTLDTSEDIAEWNKGNIQMLLCHPASAGMGLNLQQGGHLMVWFGLPWSLELLQQAEARLHRQGQEQSVIVHRIICAGTLDERVLSVLTRKDATQRSLLTALKEYVEELR
jgi:SNF2 family DNA or RNA helicase